MNNKVWAITAVLLTGCAVGPDYQPPSFDAPSKFVGGASGELREAAGVAWWKDLNDAALNELVSIGLTQNLDVKTALERIVEAEQNARRFGVIESQVAGNSAWSARRRKTDGVLSEDASLSGEASFALDLFGEFRRAREQSLAELDAANFEAGTVKLAYLSDIVTAYALVRVNQAAAQISRETIASRRETLNVIRQRAELQDGTQLEVAQAQSLLAAAEANLPVFEAQAKLNTFRIATLLDMPTNSVVEIFSTGRGQLTPPASATTGVPGDLLRNRPDIRAAERTLAAATAAVGVTEAQLYPSLRVFGNVTVGEVDSWAFGPSVALPIFDRGVRLSNRGAAISRARQAELAHRQTFVLAIEEVQSALTLTEARKRQVGALIKATTSSERVLNLSRRSFESGVVSIDTVLDAERTYLSDRLSLVQAQSDYVQAWVRQQVATGKGWAVQSSTALAALGDS